MFSFIDHVYEIFTISKALDVDIGVAYEPTSAPARGRTPRPSTSAASMSPLRTRLSPR